MISEGMGARKARKAMGKMAWRRVWGLNRISVNPAAKKGSVRAWYSSGVNVYELYQ